MKTDWIIIGLLCWVIADVAPAAHKLLGSTDSPELTHRSWTVIGTLPFAYGLFGSWIPVTVAAIAMAIGSLVGHLRRKGGADSPETDPPVAGS